MVKKENIGVGVLALAQTNCRPHTKWFPSITRRKPLSREPKRDPEQPPGCGPNLLAPSKEMQIPSPDAEPKWGLAGALQGCLNR